MNKMIYKLGNTLVLIVFFASCTFSPHQPTLPDYWPTNGWQSSTPEEQGMDSEMLARMVEHIQEENLDLDSLLIVRNGYLVSELYAYPYSVGQAHFVMSVTKSVMSMLVGIAIQKGYIKDVQQTLFSLLPAEGVANLDDRKKAITLENLLTMTSGLDCNENPAPGEASMFTSENWVNFMLDLPMSAKPGKTFYYCTSAIEVLSAIIQNATGMNAREFANQNLFAPLGIQTITEERWPSDPQGVTVGGYGLTLTPNEMAKLGLLYLNGGQWDGNQIMPASWVTASTTIHANRGEKKGYGYLWWIDPHGKWYAALGRAGEHIFVYPAKNLVVVFTADLPFANDADLIPLQALLNQYILPAVKSTKPLSANPEGSARLNAGIAAIGQPPRTVPPSLPAIAADISGKTYTLEDNPFGWRTMTFPFQDGASEFGITVDNQTLSIGLDNVYRIVGGDNPFPQGLRAYWESQDTFVVEDRLIGQMMAIIYHIQFSGDSLHIIQQDKYSGDEVNIEGTLTPASN